MSAITAYPSSLSSFRSDRKVREFERHVGEHRRRAYSMALQLTRNPSEAEDLLQETMVKAWRGYESYQTGRPFLNWLLRIMQRAYLDSLRRENPVRKAESLQALSQPFEGDAQELQIPDVAPGPDEEAFRKEYAGQLKLALEELPSLYRDALAMCDLDGMSYFEIALAQKTTVGTVRSRIHRGRKLLREIVLERAYSLLP
ncbi:MAG: sigma-70 family RNA polymerase sigma factor [Armatimonadetes bacterium]|nr:sigma-70 family RNA polymerase sigma factor [Armatimonadota bacterium]